MREVKRSCGTWQSRATFIVFLTVFLSLGSTELGQAQGLSGLAKSFMPTIDVQLEHPPSLGLEVQRVAFGPATGECADELVDILIEDFVAHEVEVIERQRLDEILTEIDLSVSGYIDPDDAVSIGQVLGPSALIFVNGQRCAGEKSRSSKKTETKDGSYTTYKTTTTFHFKSSLRIVDLATGRIFTAKTVEASPSETASSRDGWPAYPSEFELHNAAVRDSGEQVHRMFFPWTETKSLRFFKEKKCNMAAAFRQLQIGNVEGAAELSLASLETCRKDPKVKPKLLGKAYYNVGMSYFVQNEHDKAIEYFEKAYATRTGGFVRETIQECKQAQQDAEEMRRYETRVAAATGTPARQEVAAVPANSDDGPFAEQKNTTERSAVDRLRELKELFKQGLLSQEEYDSKRDEILAGL